MSTFDDVLCNQLENVLPARAPETFKNVWVWHRFPRPRRPRSPISINARKLDNFREKRPRINFSLQIRFRTQNVHFPRGLHTYTKESSREAASGGGAAEGAGGGRGPLIAQPRTWARAGQPWGPFAPGVRHEAVQAPGHASPTPVPPRARARQEPCTLPVGTRTPAFACGFATTAFVRWHRVASRNNTGRAPPLLSPQVGYLVRRNDWEYFHGLVQKAYFLAGAQ